VLQILLIGCTGSSYRRFAGIFGVYYTKAGPIDTNLTPTRSLSAGLLNFASGAFSEVGRRRRSLTLARRPR
jgi:hypothetical protein